MVDTFYIGGYWKNRKQRLDEIISPTLQTLNQLKDFDEQFLNLYELGKSRKQALEHNISLTSDRIEKLYKVQRLGKNDLDQNGYSKIGYRLSLWTGHSDGEASVISINAGSSSASLTDLCLIKIPSEGLARQRLLQLHKVKGMINIIIQNWDPDIVVLNSKELSDRLDTVNEIGWVTYIKKLTRKHSPSSKIIHEYTTNGGHLFYLPTDSRFAYDYSLMDQLLQLKLEIV